MILKYLKLFQVTFAAEMAELAMLTIDSMSGQFSRTFSKFGGFFVSSIEEKDNI